MQELHRGGPLHRDHIRATVIRLLTNLHQAASEANDLRLAGDGLLPPHTREVSPPGPHAGSPPRLLDIQLHELATRYVSSQLRLPAGWELIVAGEEATFQQTNRLAQARGPALIILIDALDGTSSYMTMGAGYGAAFVAFARLPGSSLDLPLGAGIIDSSGIGLIDFPDHHMMLDNATITPQLFSAKHPDHLGAISGLSAQTGHITAVVNLSAGRAAARFDRVYRALSDAFDTDVELINIGAGTAAAVAMATREVDIAIRGRKLMTAYDAAGTWLLIRAGATVSGFDDPSAWSSRVFSDLMTQRITHMSAPIPRHIIARTPTLHGNLFNALPHT
ncbi:MAG: hypothetical protein ACK5KO_09075 [Arachnia sp.]